MDPSGSPDRYLQRLLGAIEQAGGAASIVVIVGGRTITGVTISERALAEALDQGVRQALASVERSMSADEPVLVHLLDPAHGNETTHEAGDTAEIRYLHLRNVVIADPAGPTTFSWLRIRLADVSAWMLGADELNQMGEHGA